MPLQSLVEQVCDDGNAEIAVVRNEPGHLVLLLRLRHVSGPVTRGDGLLERGNQRGRELVDRAAGGVDYPQDHLNVGELIGRTRDDLGDRRMNQGNRVLDELGKPARHQPLRLVTPGIEIENDGRDGRIVGSVAQNRLLDAQNRREIVALTHAGEELGDVRAVEPLPQQLVDGLQLGQVVVVVERRPSLPPWRVEQAAFAICADIA